MGSGCKIGIPIAGWSRESARYACRSAMSSKASSLESSFRDACGQSIVGPSIAPEQLDAFRDDRGELPRNVFQLARQKAAGRPPGAKNKRNDVLAKLICQQHGDPVQYMASLYSMPLDQIIDLVKLASPGSGKAVSGDLAIRALGVQLAAAKEVAQYVHSKKPVEANVNVKSDGTILMGGAVTSAEWQGGQGPVGEVLRQIESAVKSGDIDASRLSDIRIVDAEYHVVGDDDDDGDDDGDMGE
jgi:hypothetical protein